MTGRGATRSSAVPISGAVLKIGRVAKQQQQQRRAEDGALPRYLVGIDLGTTNSAVAYVDTAAETWAVRDFAVPQLTAASEVEARAVLPSFHYEPAAGELAAGATRLPWEQADGGYVVGQFARDHGAAVPGRLVVSAKSWLSHAGVDRTAPLLPWHAGPDVTKLSPVEVSRRYLAHVRAAWDAAHPDAPLAGQDVVLTVPASFDEVARELTVEAARGAGIARVTLLEEPQAAFYAWISGDGEEGGQGKQRWESRVKAGQKILVCDVGGGTSDFTLIRVRADEGGKVAFHRVAVGEHLILGGDNLDLALAHHIERRLKGPGGKLDPRQWGPLVRTCRALKETLLGPGAPEKVSVSVSGGGSKLIGGATQLEVTRAEVREVLLEGFLPRVGLDARPAARQSGFQEFGLPYAPDAAITKYLAAFLVAHRFAGEEGMGRWGDGEVGSGDPARPDLVLFNGGLFESAVLRERLIEVLSSWFPGGGTAWRPEVLENERLDLAVARGAAYYGTVRRGRGVRISGGLARSYYVGVESGERREVKALTLLPAGAEEGRDVELPGRTFELLIRQPVEFPLFVSSTRTTDPPGALLDVDPEQIRALPPIRTVLQSGRKSAADTVRVTLHGRLTEIGTLEMWCAEVGGDRTWKLAFDVRGTQRSDFAEHGGAGAAEAQGVVDESVVRQCAGLIRATFTRGSVERPEGLAKRLEQATGTPRAEWPASLMRAFWEVLLEVEPGRRLSDQHEARWLGLLGYCLRPGYGLAVDDWRVAQTWRLYPQRIVHAKNEGVRSEWWVLWRRLAGGLSAGQQQTLAQPLLGAFRDRIRMPGSGGRNREPAFQFGAHETAEAWRALGAMELLPVETKQELARMLLDVLARERPAGTYDAALWALGRIGSRVPVYGPLNALSPAEAVESWLTTLTGLKHASSAAQFAAVQMARRTGDRYRDVSDVTRERVAGWLAAVNAPAHFVTLVRDGGRLEAEEQKAAFGESLPRGLRIE
jgi:molecular chaperone DnaK (HSP70)